ncbi:ABC transporter permease [Paenibacillus qinlingensis]|uniref:ABC-2 type transport system permease protein n=1 Tax=Paenibacillus qinlingensis TaxID=1837343 RepID=A0ABU1NVG4_9BACL|nr:ABC transporter permease [Paenibacillus qinlingensis]MDR6551456.1 ABC-2 type transport system permease protein [Paenibacillus qinlingensis]
MRIRAIVIRILRQFFHDKRTLMMMLIAPMLILFMMSLVFNGNTYTPKLGAVNVPAPLIQKLQDLNAEVTVYTAEEAQTKLDNVQLDAVLVMNGTTPQLTLEGSDPSKNKAVLFLLQKALQSAATAGTAPAQTPAITYLHGAADMAAFDNFGPVLIGFFVFFFVFLLSGVSFLRERTGGTLERLLATPLRRWEIVVGYILGFGIFTTLQATLIAWFATCVLGLMMVGSFWYVLLITLLLALAALSLGTLISAFANNEFQMIQFIPLIIVPQVFFSGLFSLDTMSVYLRWIGHLMPLYYGADALRNIMIRGAGWDRIWLDVLVLAAFTIVFMFLNIVALKKHRKL